MSAFKLPIFDRKYFPWKLALILFFLSGGLLLAGRYYYFSQKKQIFTEQQNILEAIAKLKIRQIEQWHKDRLGDAMILRDNYFLIREISNFFISDHNSAAKVEINRWMKSFENKYDYYGYLIVDDKMRIRLTSSLSDSLKTDIIHRQLDEVMKDKKIIMTELHKDNNAGVVHMDLLIPLIDQESKEPRSFGAVILHIAPGEVLYPLIQSWPTASKSSETLIVRKEGDSVLFLNELRHRQHTALSLKYPLSNTDLLAVKALENDVGIVEGVDYRGIPVLGYISGIPGLPWHMIAKVDKEEIMKPLKKYLYLTMFVATLLVLINAIIFIFWVWDQRMKLNMSNLQSEIERKALTNHYQYLFKYANDIIILTDRNFQIVEINEKGLKTYGYTREDIIGMDSALFETPSRITETRQHRKILEESGADFFEATHIGKDGSELTVEISARVIEIDGIEFFQLIGRDITERRITHNSLLDSQLKYKSLFEYSGIGITIVDKDGQFVSINTIAAERMGGKPEDFEGRSMRDILSPEESEKYLSLNRAIFETGTSRTYEDKFSLKSGDISFLVVDSPVFDSKGDVVSLQSCSIDITQLRQTQVNLAESEKQYRTLFESMIQGVVYQNSDGEIISANPASEEILGLTVDQMKGRKSIDPRWKAIREDGSDFPGEEHPSMVSLRTGYEIKNAVMGIFNPIHNKYTWIHVSAVPQFHPGETKPFQVFATFDDFTDRKEADEKLRKSEDLFRKLFENMLNGFAYCKMIYEQERPVDFIYLSVNKAFETQTGLRNVGGKRVSEIITDIREKDYELIESYGRVASTGIPESFELYVESMDMWFSIAVNSPQKEYFVFVFDVITERKEAERISREMERIKSELLDNLNEAQLMSQIGSWSWDLANNSVWWSDETYRIFGVTPDNYTPGFSKNGEFIHPDDLDKYNKIFEHALRTGEKIDTEFRLISGDGQLKICQSKAKNNYNNEGQSISMSGTIMDITSNKRKEEEISLRNQELERFNRLATGRELRMVELKVKINELSLQLGLVPPYMTDYMKEIQRADSETGTDNIASAG